MCSRDSSPKRGVNGEVSHPLRGLREHILRKGRALFLEATHLVDLFPVSLNMLCSLLKQWFPCCWSPPWGHPASFQWLSRFCPSWRAHLKGQLLPATFPKNASPHCPFGFRIPSIIAISLQFHFLFFAAVCCFLIVSSWWVSWGCRYWQFIHVLFHWLNH